MRVDCAIRPFGLAGILGACALALTVLVGCATARELAREPVAVDVWVSAEDQALLGGLRSSGLAIAVRRPLAALRALRPSKVATSDSLRNAREALRQAKSAYRRLRFDEALRVLHTAQPVLISHAAGPEHLRLLGQLLFWRGLSHLALKQETLADTALCGALAAGVGDFPVGTFAPEIEARISRLRQTRAAQGTGTLSIRSEPPAAEVFVDGKLVGRSPVDVNVFGGPHHVRLQRLGFVQTAALIEARARATSSHPFRLSVAPNEVIAAQLLAYRRRAGRLPANAKLIGRLLATQFTAGRGFAWLQRGDDGPEAQLHWYDRKGRLLTSVPPCAAGSGVATVEACQRSLLRARATGRRGLAHKTTGKPFYRRWWFWAVAGGTVAAAAVGTAAYVATREPEGTNVDIVLR